MKGNDAVKGAAHVLRNNPSLPIEFAGFVEGDDISEGTVDVIVTDGFTGNVALKTAEGTAKLIVHYLRNALRRVPSSAVSAPLSPPARSTPCAASSTRAPPMAASSSALCGVVVKSHGGADALGFASALDMAIDMAKANVIARIVADRAGIRTLEPEAVAS